jgi:hypothetical protein
MIVNLISKQGYHYARIEDTIEADDYTDDEGKIWRLTDYNAKTVIRFNGIATCIIRIKIDGATMTIENMLDIDEMRKKLLIPGNVKTQHYKGPIYTTKVKRINIFYGMTSVYSNYAITKKLMKLGIYYNTFNLGVEIGYNVRNNSVFPIGRKHIDKINNTLTNIIRNMYDLFLIYTNRADKYVREKTLKSLLYKTGILLPSENPYNDRGTTGNGLKFIFKHGSDRFIHKIINDSKVYNRMHFMYAIAKSYKACVNIYYRTSKNTISEFEEAYDRNLKSAPKFMRKCKIIAFRDVTQDHTLSSFQGIVDENNVTNFGRYETSLINLMHENIRFGISTTQSTIKTKMLKNIESTKKALKLYCVIHNLKPYPSIKKIGQMTTYINDGYNIANSIKRRYTDDVSSAEALEIVNKLPKFKISSPYNMTKLSKIFHDANVKLNILGRKHRTPDEPMKLDYIIPEELNRYYIQTKHALIDAGCELGHCIGSYSNAKGNILHFRKGTVCAQVKMSGDKKGHMVQCYDKNNQTTKKSNSFKREINSLISKIQIKEGIKEKEEEEMGEANVAF